MVCPKVKKINGNMRREKMGRREREYWENGNRGNVSELQGND